MLDLMRANARWKCVPQLVALVAAGCAFACDETSLPDAGPLDSGQPPHDAHVPMDAEPPDSGPQDASVDAGPVDSGVPDSGVADSGARDAATDGGPALVEVGHERELRGVWVPTVWSLDFPSHTSLTAAQARAELASIVDTSARAGFNAIFFQVRPESDALYNSLLEPWSRFVSGAQGTDPGYDPLAILIELAHEQGIEVHAWINPYRASTSADLPAASNHVRNRFPEAAITYGSAIIMDPSHEGVRNHIVAVVRDLVRRYDVDGVAIDDYFYPYPIAGQPFPDEAQYQAYLASGGTLGKSDWRRENVNALVAALNTAIKEEKAWVRWGASPFGIYRPGMPPGIVGTDAYEVLACDGVRWLAEGWVDYLSPQLYWSSDSTGQPFGPLVQWWSEQARPGRPIIPSLGLYRVTEQNWPVEEMETQVALTRAIGSDAAGAIWYRYANVRDDQKGERAMLERVHAKPALPPIVPGMEGSIVEPPLVTPSGGGLLLSHPSRQTLRGYAIYRYDEGDWIFEHWVPVASGAVLLEAGRYAVTAVNRGSVESLGVDVTIP